MFIIYSNIYIITNLVNDKKYIGQSIDVSSRWRQHVKDSKNNRLKSRYLYSSFNKYGIKNFNLETIEENVPINRIDEREKYWISYYNTFAPNGYNLTHGGEGSLGRKHTLLSKRKISEKAKIWHSKNKDIFRSLIKNRNTINIYSIDTILKRVETWKSNPENKTKVIKNLTNYTSSMSEEEKNENYKKAIQTKKEKEYDFYSFSFGKMNEEEKDKMYEKISINNSRSQNILMIDQNDNMIKEFHSIGEAGRYLHEEFNYSKNSKVNIRKVLDTNKIAYGYKWKHK